jgi:hypothetical protein
MGITIHYRGRLADLTQIEDFEDRLVDFAVEIGGQARIWRTWANDTPERMVRGVILNVAPGQDSASLLVSPEGWLIGLTDIEDAELGRLTEPPWCFVKTQFGSAEGHVVFVEMLADLKREFLPDLEVSDEGDYWETRDAAELVRKRLLMQEAIDGLAEGLRRYGLNSEAAEDPAILLRHIERVAAKVHRSLRRPAEHAPVELDDDLDGASDPKITENQRDELYKQNRRHQERMHRAIDERLNRGEDHETAFREALREVVPDHEEDEQHPLLRRATDLIVQLDSIFPEQDPHLAPSLDILYRGLCEIAGGLAQALSDRDHDSDQYGQRIVQLKRALRGAAFAHGALFPLRTSLAKTKSAELFRTLEQMQTDILAEQDRVRSEQRRDGS